MHALEALNSRLSAPMPMISMGAFCLRFLGLKMRRFFGPLVLPCSPKTVCAGKFIALGPKESAAGAGGGVGRGVGVAVSVGVAVLVAVAVGVAVGVGVAVLVAVGVAAAALTALRASVIPAPDKLLGPGFSLGRAVEVIISSSADGLRLPFFESAKAAIAAA